MPEVTLRLTEMRTAKYKGKDIRLSEYDVLVDGQKIGKVARTMMTRERRSRGARYVHARWQSPGWEVRQNGRFSGLECYSRVEGVRRLLEYEAAIKWSESKDLAAAAKVVKV